MANYKRKKAASILVCCVMGLVLVLGMFALIKTHLDKGVLAKYSPAQVESVVKDFVSCIQKGDKKALEYVWYNDDSDKMQKSIGGYNTDDLDKVIEDEQKAYKGLKKLLEDPAGNELLQVVFAETIVNGSKADDLKVRDRTLYDTGVVLQCKDYGHTGLYYMYENCMDSGAVSFDSIGSLTELLQGINAEVPISSIEDCGYVVYSGGELKLNAFMLLRSLGIDDVIYTGSKDGALTIASIGGICMFEDYTATSENEGDAETEKALIDILGIVEEKNIDGLYEYIAGISKDKQISIIGKLGNLLYNYETLNEGVLDELHTKLLEYDNPSTLSFRTSAGFLGCICLIKTSEGYFEPMLYIDVDSIGDSMEKFINCTDSLYVQFIDAMYQIGITNKEGLLVGNTVDVTPSSSEAASSDGEEEDPDVPTSEASSEDFSDDSDDESVLDSVKNTVTSIFDKEDSDVKDAAEWSTDNGKHENDQNFYSEEVQQTIEENQYSDEKEYNYYEGNPASQSDSNEGAFD